MPSAARARTRRLLLDAAVVVLAKDAKASLGQIADAAGVGRTTLHRYFPERADLLAALTADFREQFAAANERAALADGLAAQAIERLCLEYLQFANHLALLVTDTLSEKDVFIGDELALEASLHATVSRGHKDGSIDPALTPEWISATLYALIYAVGDLLAYTGVTRYEASRQLIHTLRKTLAP
ncbi:MAG: TetR/AcrR family transcriptional regulator [Promicromonosporaceae bacterium]|nr:TetR/AcrR family transcriptional regulator [Promicromonosporaceae bacterium]